MDKNKAIESVNEIKELMERSSKFVSLSGMTAVLAGVYALAGAYVAGQLLRSGDNREGLVSSVMLLFYGLSLVNVSKFTYSNVAWLGYAFLCLGIADCFFEGHGLMFWTIGFGGFHILYGMLFYLQYERKK